MSNNQVSLVDDHFLYFHDIVLFSGDIVRRNCMLITLRG